MRQDLDVCAVTFAWKEFPKLLERRLPTLWEEGEPGGVEVAALLVDEFSASFSLSFHLLEAQIRLPTST